MTLKDVLFVCLLFCGVVVFLICVGISNTATPQEQGKVAVEKKAAQMLIEDQKTLSDVVADPKNWHVVILDKFLFLE